MSSALTITDRAPFEHQLGTDIRAARTVNEALTISGLNWGLRGIPSVSVTLMGADAITIGSMPGRRFIVRDDDYTILDAIGSRYTTIDNAAAFKVANPSCILGAQFDAAGEIDHGRTTLMLTTIPEASTKIGGHYEVQLNVVISTSHSGGGAANQSVTARRRVRTNGLTLVRTTGQHRGLGRSGITRPPIRTACRHSSKRYAGAGSVSDLPTSTRRNSSSTTTTAPASPPGCPKKSSVGLLIVVRAPSGAGALPADPQRTVHLGSLSHA
ncbi:hypothetical protein ABIE38_003500 [Dietzia sp. 2505]|uniref:DUF932 domain-containing protein n=1 Tax=Dietzia sp. 2505 TaxID=3156457 RepID=UPI003399BFAF